LLINFFLLINNSTDLTDVHHAFLAHADYSSPYHLASDIASRRKVISYKSQQYLSTQSVCNEEYLTACTGHQKCHISWTSRTQ